MHKYSAESCVAESFDMCYAEVQPERYALACVLKRDSSRETWTVGRKQFNSTVLSGFFGGGVGKNLCALRLKMEFPLTLMMKVIVRGSNTCGYIPKLFHYIIF